MSRFLFSLCIVALVCACGPRRLPSRPAPALKAAAAKPRPAPARPAVAPAAPLPALPAAAALTPAAPDRAQTLAAARAEMEKSYRYTALSDAQIARQQAAAATLVSGDPARALDTLQQLNRELESGFAAYSVRPGDSLWRIAGRPEVYNNSWLWPLIWAENRDELLRPERVFAGQELQIRLHPTVEQLARVLAETARPRSRIEIGVIRELPR